MSRIPNANASLLAFCRICKDYKRLFGPRIAAIRKKYAESPLRKPPSTVDESLKAHSRVYIVNALLAALHWRLDANPGDGLPNLLPEARDPA